MTCSPSLDFLPNNHPLLLLPGPRGDDVCLERPILLQSHKQNGGWGYSDRILHVFFHTDSILPILQFYMLCIEGSLFTLTLTRYSLLVTRYSLQTHSLFSKIYSLFFTIYSLFSTIAFYNLLVATGSQLARCKFTSC